MLKFAPRPHVKGGLRANRALRSIKRDDAQFHARDAERKEPARSSPRNTAPPHGEGERTEPARSGPRQTAPPHESDGRGTNGTCEVGPSSTPRHPTSEENAERTVHVRSGPHDTVPHHEVDADEERMEPMWAIDCIIA